MSAQSTSLLGYGLYFIDVLACLLFSITLALVGARFGHEQTVPVELPELASAGGAGDALDGATITLRAEGDALELFFNDQRVGFDELAERLGRDLVPSVVVRSEESSLTRVIGIAHAAGVRDIQLAYEKISPNAMPAAGGRR